MRIEVRANFGSILQSEGTNMDATNHSNCSYFEEFLEQHICAIKDLKQAEDALSKDPESDAVQLALRQAAEAEFACRNKVRSYKSITAVERKKQSLHLAAFLIACNCPLNKPLFRPANCSGIAKRVRNPDQ
jgi:hypothetical protein